MTEREFISQAKQQVAKLRNTRIMDKPPISEDNISLVWFNYTLGNMKCLAITSDMDGTYYEITYRKEKSVMYIDFYKKNNHLEVNVD